MTQDGCTQSYDSTMASLNPHEEALVTAIALTMKAACALASQRDQLVAEGGHTIESARDFLVAKWGAPDKPVAALIDWWDHECSYSVPAFTQIMDAMNVTPSMREFVLKCGAQADGIMAKMLAAARRTH